MNRREEVERAADATGGVVAEPTPQLPDRIVPAATGPRWRVTYSWHGWGVTDSDVVTAPDAVHAAWKVAGGWVDGMQPYLISVEEEPRD